MKTKDQIILELKQKLRKAKEEIGYLNVLLADADEGSWDIDLIYKDIRDGTDNGNNIGGVPNKKMASWYARRWNLNEGELADD